MVLVPCVLYSSRVGKVLISRTLLASRNLLPFIFRYGIKLFFLHIIFASGLRKQEIKPTEVQIAEFKFSFPINRISVRTFVDVFLFRYHLPKTPVRENAVILDFGSNIGLTLLDFSLRYPRSQIFGYEIDYSNFLISREITSERTNVSIINTGVAQMSGEMYYDPGRDSDAYCLQESKLETFVVVQTESIRSILSKYSEIDYIKMDIEGTELQVLNSLRKEDVEHVKELQVEIHDQVSNLELRSCLEKIGFKVFNHEHHWSALRAIKPEFIK